MVKKSKQFENLNIVKTSKTENVILQEFLNNINSHLNYLKKNFPNFWMNYYSINFCSKLTLENINKDNGKKTIESLKILFQELQIAKEANDVERIKQITPKEIDSNFLSIDHIFKNNFQTKSFKKACELCEFLVRSERNNKRVLNFLSPLGYEKFIGVKEEVLPVLEEREFLDLGKFEHNPKKLMLKKKKYLSKKKLEPAYLFIFYRDFEKFCTNYMHAKGIGALKENIKIFSNGFPVETEVQIAIPGFYKSFLTYQAFNQLLISSSGFGKELFGKSKNPFTPEGTFINKYDSFFLDTKLSEQIRKISFIKKMQFQDYFEFRDENNKESFTNFMNCKSDSVLIPLRIMRHFFVNGQGVFNEFLTHNNNILTNNDNEILSLMNLKVLGWCSKKFEQCMKFFVKT